MTMDQIRVPLRLLTGERLCPLVGWRQQSTGTRASAYANWDEDRSGVKVASNCEVVLATARPSGWCAAAEGPDQRASIRACNADPAGPIPAIDDPLPCLSPPPADCVVRTNACTALPLSVYRCLSVCVCACVHAGHRPDHTHAQTCKQTDRHWHKRVALSSTLLECVSLSLSVSVRAF
ncbi:unnamed protein product [Protopolystoma xenopodis]|uniref:Uncharacterized protein n=1 Tax=Protopolystoma xenopodis TaxID=117903 RepID=A0A3S5B8B5_9PLAT|nr:unnamed protein product [Protopolystoma xenopodis]